MYKERSRRRQPNVVNRVYLKVPPSNPGRFAASMTKSPTPLKPAAKRKAAAKRKPAVKRKSTVKREPVAKTLHQVAALPMRRRDGRIEVCLITTRTTGRWTVPKGWPMKGRKDFTAARIEAEQEAGVTGKPGKKPIGSFLYWKRRDAHFDLVRVAVYPLDVTRSLETWKEKGERQIRWVDPGDASIVVEEPGLASLLMKINAANPQADTSGDGRTPAPPPA